MDFVCVLPDLQHLLMHMPSGRPRATNQALRRSIWLTFVITRIRLCVKIAAWTSLALLFLHCGLKLWSTAAHAVLQTLATSIDFIHPAAWATALALLLLCLTAQSPNPTLAYNRSD